MCHDLAPVNPTNIANAAIKMTAFVACKVRVAPYTWPRDQLVPIEDRKSVFNSFSEISRWSQRRIAGIYWEALLDMQVR